MARRKRNYVAKVLPGDFIRLDTLAAVKVWTPVVMLAGKEHWRGESYDQTDSNAKKRAQAAADKAAKSLDWYYQKDGVDWQEQRRAKAAAKTRAEAEDRARRRKVTATAPRLLEALRAILEAKGLDATLTHLGENSPLARACAEGRDVVREATTVESV